MGEPVTTDSHAFPTPRAVARASNRVAVFNGAGALFFLLLLIVPSWQEHNAARATVITLLCLVIGVLSVYSSGIREFADRYRYGWVGLMFLTLLALWFLIGTGIGYLVIFVVMIEAIALPWTVGVWVVGATALGGVVMGSYVDDMVIVTLTMCGSFLAMSIGFAISRAAVQARLDEAEKRNALLAVSAERERIGRDLHDILGHSLTSITVSAQLAQRLVDADPAAAAQQMAEIERISRQSLADVRATASGMQQVRVATEIASARSVLIASGIDPVTPISLPSLPDERAELFGYVVRESVTNVVRHSRGSRCTIEVTPDEVWVSDDGLGCSGKPHGTGLSGLAARVEEAGGRLTVGPGAERGTVVHARMGVK